MFTTQTIALPKSPISASPESDDSIHGKQDEQQPTHSAADPLSHSDDDQPVRTSKRIPYALPISHLPKQEQTFIAHSTAYKLRSPEMRHFSTKTLDSHSLFVFLGSLFF